MYSCFAQACLQYLGNLIFCVPETFGCGEFQETFIKPGSAVLLIEMWLYHLMGCFDACLNEKECGGCKDARYFQSIMRVNIGK